MVGLETRRNVLDKCSGNPQTCFKTDLRTWKAFCTKLLLAVTWPRWSRACQPNLQGTSAFSVERGTLAAGSLAVVMSIHFSNSDWGRNIWAHEPVNAAALLWKKPLTGLSNKTSLTPLFSPCNIIHTVIFLRL